jgi:hypothetical protein
MHFIADNDIRQRELASLQSLYAGDLNSGVRPGPCVVRLDYPHVAWVYPVLNESVESLLYEAEAGYAKHYPVSLGASANDDARGAQGLAESTRRLDYRPSLACPEGRN